MKLYCIQEAICPVTNITSDNILSPSLIISIFALVCTIIQAYFMYNSNQEAKKNEIVKHQHSVDDIFWIREIIVPKCIIPSIDLLDSLVNPEQRFNSHQICYKEHIIPILNNIRDKFSLATAINYSLGAKLHKLIDDIDDNQNNLLDDDSEEFVDLPNILNQIKSELSENMISIVRTVQLS